MPAGHEGAELDEELDELDPVVDPVVVVPVGVVVGGATTTTTHAVPFQTCPSEQVMQVSPLK